MGTKILMLVIADLLFSCSSSKPVREAVSIEQVETNYPVIVRGDLDKNRIFSVNIPLAFKYTNESSTKRKVNSVRFYNCETSGTNNGNYWKGGLIIYENRNNTLERINSHFSNTNAIGASESQEFVAYTNHTFDSTQDVQLELKPYLDLIKKRGTVSAKDTLSVGTFDEFKKTHPELIKVLLEGDSISFGIVHDPKSIKYDEQNDIYINLSIEF